MITKPKRTFHRGLDKLRLALGSVMKNRSKSGALNPIHLAPLAGVNYETLRQFVNGGRDFAGDSPLAQLVAENLAFTTGVDPSFRLAGDKPIHDLWGNVYTGKSYERWTKANRLGERIHTRPLASNSKRHPAFADEWVTQSKMLLNTILSVAKAKGPAFECMAFRLVKHALVKVSRDLGLADQLAEKSASLADFQLHVASTPSATGPVLGTISVVSRWEPKTAALIVSADEPTDPKIHQAWEKLKHQHDTRRRKAKARRPLSKSKTTRRRTVSS